MKTVLFITLYPLMLLFSVFLYGQGKHVPHSVPTLYTADLDLDGQQDTVTYDPVKNELIFQLSTKEYKPDIYTTYPDTEPPYESSSLNVYEGGFYIHFTHLRTESFEFYHYKKETGKFSLELLEYSHQGFGSMTYNGTDCLFTASWWLHNDHYSLVEPEQIKLYLDRPFYWGDEPGIIELSTQLFEEYVNVYQPEKKEVIRFAGTEMDESGNNEFLQYFMSDREIGIYDIIYCNYPSLKVGETIEVTVGTSVFIEPGDGRWHAVKGIIDIKAVKITD